MAAARTSKEEKELMHQLHQRHPGFRIAVTEDVRVTSLHRGEGHEVKSGWGVAWRAAQLAWASDAFFAQLCYRLRMRLKARRVPVIPSLLHRLSMITAQVSIGDPVLMHPGVYIVHGQVVADGLVEIGPDTVIAPWTLFGLLSGNVQGPTVGRGCFIGTGAKVLGPVRVGDGAVVGANSVVTRDVEAGATATGAPARPRKR